MDLKKAIILCAGYGKRVLPLTKTTPKPLLKINEVPLIEYSIRILTELGVREIAVNVHHLKDKIIVLEYISDGLATDNEMKIHKFAEDAMYQSILFNLLSTRIGVPEFIINRYRRSRRAAMRNAKIRLSNLKVGELTQVMRGKSKHIKH